ncbi:MAG: hypothetical protein EBR82_12170 [Caulobacteraceae bacterium]|nr:hypothetical protein [Caulobacteraceae bacterium]
MDLVDQSGQIVSVPDDKAQDAYLSGQYGVVSPKVDVRTPDGKLGSVAADNLQKVLQAGYQLVPPAQATQERLEKKYGSAGGTAVAGAEGFLRGLTLGASDTLAEYGAGFAGAVKDLASGQTVNESQTAQQWQQAVKEHLRNYQEANKGTAVGTEIAGAIAPIILSDGGALAAEGGLQGAKAGVTGARALGEGAELARGIQTGAELAQTARATEATTGLAKAAKTSLGVLGAPNRAVAAVGDVADQLATRALQTALGDGSTSGLARAATKALGSGARGAAEGALYGVAQNFDEQMLGDEKLNGEKLVASGVYGGLLGLGVGSALSGLGSAVEKVPSLLKGSTSAGGSALRDAAEVQGFRSMSLNLKDVKLLEKVPGGIQGAGRQFLDNGLIQAGDKTETMLPRFQTALEEKGAQLGDVRAKLEQVGLGPKLDEVIGKLSPLRQELEKLPNASRGARKTFDALQEDLVTSLGDKPTFQGLADFKTTLGKQINWRSASGENAANDVKKAFYGALREHELDALTTPAAKKALGAEATRDMQQTLLDYRRLAIATRGLEDRVAADARNRVISPSDYGVGIGTGAAAIASGHPVGALLGVASSLGHKVLRERGNSTAAIALDKIADMAGIAKRVDQFDTRIERGIDTFVSKKQFRRVSGLGDNVASNDNYAAAVRKVQAIAADKTAAATAAQHHLGSVSSTAPRTTQAFTSTLEIAAKFLHNKLPPGQKFSESDLQPHLHEARVSDADKAKFMRYARAVDDPASVVDDMAEGRLTPEAVESLRAVYPAIYDQIRAQAISRIADEKHPISYTQRVQMGILLGLPTDKTLAPKFVQSMQQTFGAKKPEQGPTSTQAAPKRKLDLADDLKLANR